MEGVNFQANGDGRQLVLIEGNIGAGKTTVGNTIAAANMFGFIEEPTAVWREGFASNMLELFYSDTERWAFTFQICAFVTRAKTWHEIWQRTDRNRVILERSIYCDRYVFAENCYRTGLFTKAEYQLYCSMWDFMVESVFAKHNKSTGQGKAKISREIIPILSLIQDKIVQAHYVELVAAKLSVPVEAVSRQLSQSYSTTKVAEDNAAFVEEKTRRQLLEERFLSIAFKLDNELLSKKSYQDFFSTPLAKRLVEEYKSFMKGKKKKKFSASKFTNYIPAELQKGFEDLMLQDIGSISEDNSEEYKREIQVIVRELEVLQLREKLQGVSKKIAEFENKNDKKKLQDAKKEFSKISVMLSELEDKNYKGIIL